MLRLLFYYLFMDAYEVRGLPGKCVVPADFIPGNVRGEDDLFFLSFSRSSGDPITLCWTSVAWVCFSSDSSVGWVNKDGDLVNSGIGAMVNDSFGGGLEDLVFTY